MTRKKIASGAARPGRWSIVGVAAAAAVIATLERMWFPYAWGEPATLTSVFYYGDATRFVDYALAIARGLPFDNGIPFHPPGWPLLLAAIFRMSGVSASGAVPVAAIKTIVAVLSGLSVGVAMLLAGEAAGIGALVAVALLAPFDFGHIVVGTVANSEALYGLLVALATFFSWRWLREEATHPRAAAALASAAGAAATVVRAEFLVAAVLIVAFAAVVRRRYGDAALYAVLFGLFLTPTTIWHWRMLSAFNDSHVGRVAGPLPRFAPVTSYGPFNFAMANHEDADGGPNRDHPMLDRCRDDSAAQLEAGRLDLACPAVYDLYVNGYAIGLRWLLTNPGAAAALLGRKAAFTVGFLAHGFLADDVGVGVDGVRRRVDLIDPNRSWLLPVRLALIAAGVVVLRRRRAVLAVVGAPIAALAASTLLVYGYVRLGVAYLPVVWVLEGAGLASIAFAVSGTRATRRTAAAAIVAAALIAGYDRTVRDSSRAVAMDGPRLTDGTLAQDETMEIRRR